MAWLRAGTVAVTNGSTTITGTNTGFAANTRVGDAFIGPDGRQYELQNVASDTVISILPAYLGPTASGQPYAVMPVQGYQKLLADLVRDWTGQYGQKMAALGTTGNYDVLPVTKGGTGGADQATARAGLGLGTAATANITTSSTDGTAGRILKVGDFGVGAKDNAPWQGENLNPDTFRTGGTFLGQFNITGPGTPGYALTGFLTVFGGTNSSICSQTFRSADLGLIYSRSQSGGVWKAWERAFVETITNANGTATKFPDGTLICRWSASARDSASNPQGSLFISTARFQTFAVPFVGETPTVSPASSDPNNAHCWGVVTSASELTRVQIAIMSAASNGQARLGYIAIGRWR